VKEGNNKMINFIFRLLVKSCKKYFPLALACGSLLVAFSSVYAEMVKVKITGSVTDWDLTLGVEFAVGDPLDAEYLYDSEAVGQWWPDPLVMYDLEDFSGTLGNYVFSFINGYYLFQNDSELFGDQLLVRGVVTGEDVDRFYLVGAGASFRDSDGTFLSDNSLITIAPDISVMELHQFHLQFRIIGSSSNSSVLVRADIESAQLVPIPVRIAGLSPAYYSTLQTAYDDAWDLDTIQGQGLVFNEDLSIDDVSDKSVILEGGYNNDFSSITGITTINGSMVVSNGTLIIQNGVIQIQ
jgi:hypothetical protein